MAMTDKQDGLSRLNQAADKLQRACAGGNTQQILRAAAKLCSAAVALAGQIEYGEVSQMAPPPAEAPAVPAPTLAPISEAPIASPPLPPVSAMSPDTLHAALYHKLEDRWLELFTAAHNMCGQDDEVITPAAIQFANAAERFTTARAAIIAGEPLGNITCLKCQHYLGLAPIGTIMGCKHCGNIGQVEQIDEVAVVQ